MYKRQGCTRVGVCGKSATTATLQDLLIYATKGLCEITTKLRQEKQDISRKLNQFICENLFITITNANFDDNIIKKRITDTLTYKQELLAKLQNKDNLSPVAPVSYTHLNLFKFSLAKQISTASLKEIFSPLKSLP